MRNKKLKINLMLLMIPFLLILGLNACKKDSLPDDVSHYTCPMHPQIKMDQPGSCPICGMDLVPVKKETEESTANDTGNEHEGHDHEGSTAKEEPKGIKIDPSRTQQIGLQVEKVGRQDLSKSFLLQGKVAHDPDLWVAQKEYLIALKLGDHDLIKSSEEKLYFMGLSKEWIRLIKKTRKANLGFHIPTPGEPTFFEAFLYQGDVSLLKPGTQLEIYDIKSRKLADGSIRALGTMVDLESQTVRALIQSKQTLDLKSNTLVQIKVHLPMGKHLAIPKSAILFNGDHNMVYVKSNSGKFVGKIVELGKDAGDYFEITKGLEEGEEVVTNGHFLMDSETQIKMGGQSSHQH